MRDTLFVLLVAFVSMSIGVGKSTASNSNRELQIQEEMIKTDKDWGDAVAKSDKNALSRILADDFIAVGTRGEVLDKKQNLENPAPPFPNSSYTADEYIVRGLDNSTVLLSIT